MKRITQLLKVVVFLVLGFSLVSANAALASITDRETFTDALLGKSHAQKETAIEWLIQNEPNQIATPILTAWLEGNLYYFNDRKSELYRSLYISDDVKSAASIASAWDDSKLEVSNPRAFKKVRVNNKLRGLLRLEIASMGLKSEDAQVRLDSVNQLLGSDDKAIVKRLRTLQETESNSEVQDLLTLALSIDDALLAADSATRIAAIEQLSSYKQPIVLQTLNTIINSNSEPPVVQAAKKGLGKYQQSEALYSGVETVFFGLSLGSVLVLAGIGLAITFGVMGVINMAHGELIMIGAYTTYVLQQLMPNQIGLALILSIPAAFIVSGLVGIAIERSVIRHLYGRPLETLLATFGISLILQQAVRSIFSPLNRSVSTPDWMSGALQINPMLSLTYNRLYIILFCILVFAGLLMVLKKTPLGLQVRAVSQNRGMARVMGIRSERVDALTFGLGSGVAGIAGVALSQLTNVGPNMGQAYIIDSFMVVVFGGVGNLWGTLVAGLSLGLFNKILEPWAGAVLAKILVLVFIILFIQKRPRGLFPQRGRAAES